MVIDFHVHLFPEEIAERTLEILHKNMIRVYKTDQPPCYNGTIEGLAKAMDDNGVDMSVIMPIATKVTQSGTINSFAKKISNGKTVISFGSLHPYQEDAFDTLKLLAEQGFKGIKLHPDYQRVACDDERFINVVKSAGELGLHTVIHAGIDPGVEPPCMAAADKLIRFLNRVDASRVTLAHLGAFAQWDEVEKHFIDTPAYFDTAALCRFIDTEQYKRIIDRHGADRIVFGSDMPWEAPADTYKKLAELNLSDEEMELITHKNAMKILGLT